MYHQLNSALYVGDYCKACGHEDDHVTNDFQHREGVGEEKKSCSAGQQQSHQAAAAIYYGSYVSNFSERNDSLYSPPPGPVYDELQLLYASPFY